MPPRVALSFYRRYQPVRLLGQGSRYAWAWRSCRRRVGPSGDRQGGTDQVEKSRKGDSRNHGTRHSHRREPCGRASRRTGDHGSGDPPFVPLPPHRWDYHEAEEVQFAPDSPLEGDGFEPSVPLSRHPSSHRSHAVPRESPEYRSAPKVFGHYMHQSSRLRRRRAATLAALKIVIDNPRK